MPKNDPFPFIFYNHGVPNIKTVDKVDGCYIGFANRVPKKARKAIMKNCPKPIKGFVNWGGTLMSCESMGDVYDSEIITNYGTPDDIKSFRLTNEAAKGFAEDFEKWTLEIHQLYPIVFVIGPGTPKEKTAWGKWSNTNLLQRLLPLLEDWVNQNPWLLEEEDPALKKNEDDEYQANPLTGEFDCSGKWADDDISNGEQEDYISDRFDADTLSHLIQCLPTKTNKKDQKWLEQLDALIKRLDIENP